MSVKDTIQALRLTAEIDKDGINYIADLLERTANLVEKYEGEVIPDYHKLCEQLQSENAMLKNGNKQIIDDYKLCIAERDKLKAALIEVLSLLQEVVDNMEYFPCNDRCADVINARNKRAGD